MINTSLTVLPNTKQAHGHFWGCAKKITIPGIGSKSIPYLDNNKKQCQSILG